MKPPGLAEAGDPSWSQYSRKLGDHFILIGYMMESVMADDPVHGFGRQIQFVPIELQEYRVCNRVSDHWIFREQPFPDLERRC